MPDCWGFITNLDSYRDRLHTGCDHVAWLQTMVTLAQGDTVELQGYYRAADGYFAAGHTSFWGYKVG